jgi:hypothetical protein
MPKATYNNAAQTKGQKTAVSELTPLRRLPILCCPARLQTECGPHAGGPITAAAPSRVSDH